MIVKRSFWRWPQRGMQGNAIDLFVNVLGLSFNDAMRQVVTEDIAEITQNKENTAESVVADNEATKG